MYLAFLLTDIWDLDLPGLHPRSIIIIALCGLQSGLMAAHNQIAKTTARMPGYSITDFITVPVVRNRVVTVDAASRNLS